MKIQILAFGMITDVTGRQREIDLPDGSDLQALNLRLQSLFPALQQMQYQWAVNAQLTEDDQLSLQENDIVALIPPFSGG